MQMKTFETNQRQAIPVGGQVTSVIEATDNREENFHGMRHKGLIVQDATIGFASGFCGIMCIPNDQIAIPVLLTEADLNDSNSFIVTIESWMTRIQATGENSEFGAVYAYDHTPKTSRSCMKGGKIVGFVSCTSGSVDGVTFTNLLSLFRTNT